MYYNITNQLETPQQHTSYIGCEISRTRLKSKTLHHIWKFSPMESKANNLQGRALRSQLQQLVQPVEIFVMLVFIALHVLFVHALLATT
jgi:hypothetical protein